MLTPYGDLPEGQHVIGDVVVSVNPNGWTETPVNPPAIQFIAPYEFIGLFTPSELIAILTSNDPVIIISRAKVQTIITAVDLQSPDTQQYIGYLVQLGILTEPRAARILSGQPPE